MKWYAEKTIEQGFVMISFKGCHFPKQVILRAVYFYLRYSISLRDLEEILAERGLNIVHATLNRWVVKFSPLIAISGANPAGTRGVNKILKRFGCQAPIATIRSKYLNHCTAG